MKLILNSVVIFIVIYTFDNDNVAWAPLAFFFGPLSSNFQCLPLHFHFAARYHKFTVNGKFTLIAVHRWIPWKWLCDPDIRKCHLNDSWFLGRSLTCLK